MPDYIFPTANELRVVMQDKLPRLTQDRVGFTLFPFRDYDNWLVSWEQKDNFLGLMQARGLNGVGRLSRVCTVSSGPWMRWS
jgi:hypothetical protein